MCKPFCPCVSVNYSLWPEPLQTELKKPTNANPPGAYRFNGKQTSLLGCYENRKDAWVQSGLPPMETDAASAIKTLEANFQCSGLCKAPNFWLSRDVTEGPPPNGCIFNLKQRFNQKGAALAYSTVATAAVIFLVFIFHYGLYLLDPSEVKNRKKKFIFDK